MGRERERERERMEAGNGAAKVANWALVAEEGKKEEVLERVCEQGGFAYAAQVAAACSRGDCGAAETAHEMAWEQLHSAPWHSIHPAWRDAYSLSCLLLAASFQRSGRLQDALRVLDMGLLLGGLLLRPDLNSAIDTASSSFSSQQQQQQQQHQHQRSRKEEQVSPQEHSRSSIAPDLSSCAKADSLSNSHPSQVIAKLPPGSLGSSKVCKRLLLSVEEFLCEFFLPGMPVIITDAMIDWPAMKKWKNLDYLNEVVGNRTVPVEVGEHYLATEWKQELMTVCDFLKRLENPECHPNERAYLAQHPLFAQIPELQEDILIPDYCAATGGEIQSINAWIGPVGTVTPVHHDPHHNLLAQVIGRKYVRLYAPNASGALYPFSESMLNNSSQVDLDSPDHTKFPLAKDLHFWDCILDEGEMLYIPPKWWHYVKSLSSSFSVSFWWSVPDHD